MRIVFLLPVPTQPRYKKRIDGLTACGAESVVFAFERDYFKQGGAVLAYRKLGDLRSRQYARRLPALIGAVGRVLGEVRRSGTVYCFGLDVAVVAILARWLTFWHATQIVLEIGDIRPVMLGGTLTSRFLRRIERAVLGRCSRVVVTSPDFVHHYFVAIQRQPVGKFFVIENKLDVDIPPLPDSVFWDDSRPLRIGYFGLLRDSTSWRILVSAIERYPERFQLIVYGRPFGIPDFDASVRSHKGIFYGGEYAWPADLPKLYGSVDIVWACYPKTAEQRVGDLWKWPMTNRFYEACAFTTPMVSQTDSADGRRVQAFGIGVTVDTDFPQETIDTFLRMTPTILAQWRQAQHKVPADIYLYNDEHCRFLSSLGASEKGLTLS